jgi:hypothetical protein
MSSLYKKYNTMHILYPLTIKKLMKVLYMTSIKRNPHGYITRTAYNMFASGHNYNNSQKIFGILVVHLRKYFINTIIAFLHMTYFIIKNKRTTLQFAQSFNKLGFITLH